MQSTLVNAAVMLVLGSLSINAAAQKAQPGTAPPMAAENTVAEDHSGELKFNIGGGYEYGFGSDFSGDGDVDISRFTFGLGVSKDLNRDLNMSFRLSYDLDVYNFSDSSSLAPTNPWDDIHTLGLAMIFTWEFANDWSVFAGPVLAFAGESGADWGKSVLGGGVIGVTYHASKDLTVGFGAGVTTQIEDDPRGFPILIIDWQITDQLRLSSNTSGASGRTGVELVWSPSKSWDFAIGAANKYSRFRLDDQGVAPDGVGVESSTPVWLRAGYTFNDHIALDMFGGATTGGKFRLEDSNGGKLSDAKFDPAFFVGAFLKVKF